MYIASLVTIEMKYALIEYAKIRALCSQMGLTVTYSISWMIMKLLYAQGICQSHVKLEKRKEF